jgi:hypothetical protein
MMGWTTRAPHMNRIFRAMVVGATALTLAARAETPADVLKKPLPP